MTENRIVIFSNGIADFQRAYEIEANSTTSISIPVRRDHLADVLASFNVFGDVTLESPPTFRPSNELEGNISISPDGALESLAQDLSGTKVRVERAAGPIEGTLVGLHPEQEGTSGDPIYPPALVVLTDSGLQRCLLREVQSLQFLDESVRLEIEKALQRNYQKIKPNSTFVEFTLRSEDSKAEAVVQYTIPAAAWKISYRLRLRDNEPAELQGFAIIDNNTDEDWKDVYVSVVTGEPITFSTDLAESKIPERERKNLVPHAALGAVEVEEAVLMASGGAAYDETSSMAGYDMADHSFRQKRGTLAKRSAPMHSAKVNTADVQETGDFSIFSSNSPVTVPAQRSQVIPVFNSTVGETKSVLHYKYANHSERPYRAVDFKNTEAFGLGRGVCTVFDAGTYAGSCILPALKPDEQQLLPHALETGVRIRKEQKRANNQLISLRIQNGVCYTSRQKTKETNYYIKNNHDREFDLVLDHDYELTEPDVRGFASRGNEREDIASTGKLPNGLRYAIKLAPKSEFAVKLIEHVVENSTLEIVNSDNELYDQNLTWLENNTIIKNGLLPNHDEIDQCLKLKKELSRIDREIEKRQEKINKLIERQERLRKNIGTGGQDEVTSRWRNELDQSEKLIRQIEEQELPKLESEKSTVEEKLCEALKSLDSQWKHE